MKVNKYIFVTITFALAGWLVACESEAVVPDPIALTREANGHYCGMIVVDHPGPKAQVHEKGRDKPRWFLLCAMRWLI